MILILTPELNPAYPPGISQLADICLSYQHVNANEHEAPAYAIIFITTDAKSGAQIGFVVVL